MNNFNLNINKMKEYTKYIISIYQEVNNSRKSYDTFCVYSNNLDILIEECNKALESLKYIKEHINDFTTSTLKMITYSYILIPLVYSFKLPEFYLAEFNKNIASCNNLEIVIQFINSIKL